MGRKKINEEEKKKTFTLHIPIELSEKFENLNIKNKSAFFSELLEKYFNREMDKNGNGKEIGNENGK